MNLSCRNVWRDILDIEPDIAYVSVCVQVFDSERQVGGGVG